MKNYFDEFLKGAQDIIRIPSVQGPAVEGKPFGEDVARCLDYTLALARSMGFRVVNNGYYYGYAEIGEGDLFGILGHLDTVPFGEGWDVPPTSGDIVNGVLYGRGVLDDKVPMLATLYAVKELLDKGLLPKMRIRLIFGCNEETGWACINKYVECEELPVAAISPDSDFPVIFAEKGVLNYAVTMDMPEGLLGIEGGERPNMVMDSLNVRVAKTAPMMQYLDAHSIAHEDDADSIRLHFDGVSAHGSTPDKGVNALFPLLGIMRDVYGGIWNDLYTWLTDITGAGVGLAISDEVSGPLTMNVGHIYVADGRMVFTLDIRYPISYKDTYIYDTLHTLIPMADIVVTGSHDPLYVDPESTLVRSLLEAYHEGSGDDTPPIAIGGATYARALKNAVAFGPIFPGRESTIHQKNERVSLDDLEKMYDIYRLAIEKICF